jgi:hypothetical protein
VDTTLYESPKLPELIKNGKHYAQVISLLNTGTCVKWNPEKAGNGARSIAEAHFLADFTVLPIYLAILNRTRNTPVEFIEQIWSAYQDSARIMTKSFSDDMFEGIVSAGSSLSTDS